MYICGKKAKCGYWNNYKEKKGIKVFKVKVQVSKWKQVVERKSNSWKVKAICGKWKQTVKIWKRNVYMWK